MTYYFVPFHKGDSLSISQAFPYEKCRFMAPEDKQAQPSFARKSLPNKLKHAWSLLRFARQVSRRAKDGDVIIIWILQYAIAFSWMRFITRKKVHILALNFIDHSKGWKARLKRFLFFPLFHDSRVWLAVNCMKYLPKYQRWYPIDAARVIEMKDCNYFDYPRQNFSAGNGTIFCGGNIRDWNTFFGAARLLPDLSFIGVAGTGGIPETLLNAKPANVEVHFDFSFDAFYQYLADCSISVIALPSDVPNGITVLFQSAFLSRPVIASDVPAMEDLLYDAETNRPCGFMYPMGDPQKLADQISLLMADVEMRKELTEAMHMNISHRTPEMYSKRLYQAVNRIAQSR